MLLLPFLLFEIAQAQIATNFAETLVGTSTDQINDVVTDADGNIYCVGQFEGPAMFGGMALVSLELDAVIAKFDASGTLLWLVQGTGADNAAANGIAVDADGDVYVTGFVEGTMVIGTTGLVSGGDEDIYVMKLDGSDGSLIWANVEGSPASIPATFVETGQKIAVSTKGEVYVTGLFHLTADFSGTPLVSGSMTQPNVFFAKYDRNGVLDWVEGGISPFLLEAHDVGVDSDGNGYFSGVGNTRWEVQGTSPVSSTITSSYLVKFDVDGVLDWVEVSDGTGAINAGFGLHVEDDVVYQVGMYTGDYGVGGRTLSAAGPFEIYPFIASWQPDGDVNWLHGGDVGSAAGTAIFRDVVLSDDGVLHAAGNIFGPVEFDGLFFNSEDMLDMLVAKYLENGDIVLLERHGRRGDQDAFALALSRSQIVLAGVFFTEITLPPLPTLPGTPFTPNGILFRYDPGNQPPVANPDFYQVPAGGPMLMDVTANDFDLDGGPLGTITVITAPTGGTAISFAGQILYTPGAGFTGVDLFSYEVCDTDTPTLCDTVDVGIFVLMKTAPGAGQTLLVSELYPNPSHQLSHMRVELSEASQLELEVLNLSGHRVWTRDFGQCFPGTHDLRIPTAELPAGLYQAVLRIPGSDFRATRRLVVQH